MHHLHVPRGRVGARRGAQAAQQRHPPGRLPQAPRGAQGQRGRRLRPRGHLRRQHRHHVRQDLLRRLMRRLHPRVPHRSARPFGGARRNFPGRSHRRTQGDAQEGHGGQPVPARAP